VTEVLKTGLELLVIAIVFAGFFYWNMRTGDAPLWPGMRADRRKNPFGFWAVQVWLAAFAAMTLLAALLVLLRITPP
jgi:hypothetical protein